MIQSDDFNLGIIVLQLIGRAVATGVIHHDNLIGVSGLGAQMAQTIAQQRSAIEIDDDNRYSSCQFLPRYSRVYPLFRPLNFTTGCNIIRMTLG